MIHSQLGHMQPFYWMQFSLELNLNCSYFVLVLCSLVVCDFLQWIVSLRPVMEHCSVFEAQIPAEVNVCYSELAGAKLLDCFQEHIFHMYALEYTCIRKGSSRVKESKCNTEQNGETFVLNCRQHPRINLNIHCSSFSLAHTAVLKIEIFLESV